MIRTMVWVFVATLSLAAQAGTFTDDIKASPGQTLDLLLKTGGKVRIVGSDEASVRVEAVIKGRDAADVRVEARPTRRGVKISSKYATGATSGLSNVEFDIRVPRRFNVHVESSGGGVNIADVEGTIDGSTMGGELVLRGLRGRLNLSTMGGEIQLRSSQVDGSVSTMGGNVLIADVVGTVSGSSMGGNVVYQNVRRAGTGAVAATAKEVRISTMGGEINVGDAVAGANVSTMGGNIVIRSAKPYVKANTMGGDIQLDAVDGWIEATTMGGNVTATMVGEPGSGDRHVRISSMSGHITLTVPDGLDMRFDVTLAYTRNSRQNYGILGDFPIELRRTDEWSYRDGSPRRYIYGTGRVGSGRNLIEIDTVNGDVTIRKRQN